MTQEVRQKTWNVPLLDVHIDSEKGKIQDVSTNAVFATMQVYFGAF